MMTGDLKIKKRSKFEIAQTMVEFALVFPIVLLLTYGIIEIGRWVFIYTSVTSAAREGARYGAAAGEDSGILYYRNCAGIRNAIRRTAILTPITDSQITVWYDSGPGTPTLGPANICPSGTDVFGSDLPKLGDRIVVRINLTFNPIIRFLKFANNIPVNAMNGRTILARVPVPYP